MRTTHDRARYATASTRSCAGHANDDRLLAVAAGSRSIARDADDACDRMEIREVPGPRFPLRAGSRSPGVHPDQRAARAANDLARPIASGRVTPGKTTASRTGSRGSTLGNLGMRSPPAPVYNHVIRLLPTSDPHPLHNDRANRKRSDAWVNHERRRTASSSKELRSGSVSARRFVADRVALEGRWRDRLMRQTTWCPGLDSNQHEVSLTSS